MAKPKIELNWLDRTVGFFSPKALATRKRYKIFNNIIERKYEGADTGRRTQGWTATNASANAETAGGLPRLRARSRDLVRNNPYAARGMDVITSNVVGRGIITQLKVDNNSQVNRREQKLNGIWRAWANTTAIDFDGIHDIFGIQRLVMRSIAESGEVLIRLRRTGQRRQVGPDGKEYEIPPIQIQVLESDYLATDLIGQRAESGNRVVQGIELDSQGKIVAYHLFKDHPGGNDIFATGRLITTRIEKSDLLHPYRVERPGMLRGVPWLSNAMLRLKDLDLYEDAQLKRQQCAAMFAAFVHDLEGVDDAQEQEIQSELGEKMEPGIIEILPPGKDIKLSNPPGADNYKEYTSVVLRSIASGLGITYESMTGNLSDVNFSSGRMGWLEMARNIDAWRSNIMLGSFQKPLFSWFLDSLELIGESSKDVRGVFTPPRREMIDPVKEINAMKIAVRSGFKTLSECMREAGHEPDVQFAEIAQDMETLDRLNLTLDTDPRKVAK